MDEKHPQDGVNDALRYLAKVIVCAYLKRKRENRKN